MKRSAVALALIVACTSNKKEDGPASSGVDPTAADGGTADGDGDGDGDDDDDNNDDDDDDDADDGPQTKFDVGGDGSLVCANQPMGIVCDGSMSVLCDGNGGVEDTTNCAPEICVGGTGCVACLDGQFACHGPRVMSCDTAGVPTWTEVEVCDPAANEVCDVSLGACTTLAPIGGTEPTGVYYQYAVHDLAPDGFSQVSDVDTWQNRIYFVAMDSGFTLVVGVLDVELLDSDGDGVFEPNQHPDNPDETGPIETREFTLVETIPINNPQAYPNVMELYATATKLYWTGPTNGITEYDLATGTETQVAVHPAWMPMSAFQSLSFLGYDDINEIWYSGNEMARRVMQYDDATQTWGWSFEYPLLAGDHMDGIEVVTDLTTGTPFVYVSDMTSNFIGQYRLDPDNGWVQENLFSYVEATGAAAVEGFGYGALNHFWVGSLANTLYELGGGDLTDYIGPEG